MTRCKHDHGWFASDAIFVYQKDNYFKKPFMVELGNNLANKVELRCNIPTCKATRNVYFESKVKRFGKITSHKNQEVKSES